MLRSALVLALFASAAAELQESRGLLRSQSVRRNDTHSIATERGGFLAARPLAPAAWADFVKNNHDGSMPDAYWDFVPAYVGSVAEFCPPGGGGKGGGKKGRLRKARQSLLLGLLEASMFITIRLPVL